MMAENSFPDELSRIRKLIGDFDAAVWRRIGIVDSGSRKAFLNAISDIRPRSSDEIAIWNELTSPENRADLLRYSVFWKGNISDYAKRLFDELTADSNKRLCESTNETYG